MTTELSQSDIRNILMQLQVGDTVPQCYSHAETVEISFRDDEGENLVKIVECENGRVIDVRFEVA